MGRLEHIGRSLGVGCRFIDPEKVFLEERDVGGKGEREGGS